MNINNPPKFWLALVFLLGVVVLMLTHSLDQTAGVGMLTFVAGYVFGNGIAARQGQDVQPIIGKRTDD